MPLDWGQKQPAATTSLKQPAEKTTRKVIGWAVAAVLAVIVLFVAFIYISPDYDMYLVRSESMVPAINMGDLIITGPVPGKIDPGTVVTYVRGKDLVTHRVISIQDGKLTTKGDAVEDPDVAPVTMSQLKGVYLFRVPAMGFVANFLKTPLGWVLIVIIPVILLLAFIFWEIANEIRKMHKKRRLDNESQITRRWET
jgi:signal peptidase